MIMMTTIVMILTMMIPRESLTPTRSSAKVAKAVLVIDIVPYPQHHPHNNHQMRLKLRI